MKKLLPGGSAGPAGRAQQAELEDSELEKVSEVTMKFLSEQKCLPELKFSIFALCTVKVERRFAELKTALVEKTRSSKM